VSDERSLTLVLGVECYPTYLLPILRSTIEGEADTIVDR